MRLIDREDAINTAVNFFIEFCGGAFHEDEQRELSRRLREIPFTEPTDWIPCSERLPESSGAYLVRPSDGALEDYSDLDAVMIIPYEADAEAFGWWTERFDPVSLGCIGSDFYEVEVIAWMPLPEPYKEEIDE